MKHFEKTTAVSSTIYECECCGKRTRNTGHGEEAVELCLRCYIESLIQNAVSDYNLKEAIENELMDMFNKANTGKKLHVIYEKIISIGINN